MNIKLQHALALVAATVLISACATYSHGNAKLSGITHDQLSKQLVKGKTTEADVRNLLGDPGRTRFRRDGGEEWWYSYGTSQQDASNFIPFYSAFHKGVHSNNKRLTLLFDEHRVLEKYSFSSSNTRAGRDVGSD
jgi:outer membrane protein assembly factor BamE (lipoprotein component of BamABCDE complex)